MSLELATPLPQDAAAPDVLSTMVEAALELLDHDGIKAVTVRNLARRTYYSPSSIGYHVSPVHRFHTLLWERVGADLLGEAMRPGPCSDGWTGEVARALVERCDAQPRRAEFFAQYYPDAERTGGDGHHVFRSFLVSIGAPADEATYLARRVQLMVDLAVTTPDRTRAVERVELELRDLTDRYRSAHLAGGAQVVALPA